MLHPNSASADPKISLLLIGNCWKQKDEGRRNFFFMNIYKLVYYRTQAQFWVISLCFPFHKLQETLFFGQNVSLCICRYRKYHQAPENINICRSIKNRYLPPQTTWIVHKNTCWYMEVKWKKNEGEWNAAYSRDYVWLNRGTLHWHILI